MKGIDLADQNQDNGSLSSDDNGVGIDSKEDLANIIQAVIFASSDLINMRKLRELIGDFLEIQTVRDSVLTANINTVTYLNVDNLNINSLIGIEGFSLLTNLVCDDNQLNCK